MGANRGERPAGGPRPDAARGRADLFVVVFVFAAEQAEQREADQRGEKAQAHQRGCGRRRGSEVEDGNYQRQRDNDFQEVGHEEGRVCCAARNTAAAIACLLVNRFTRLLVLASTRLRVHGFTRLPVYLSTYSRVDSLTGPRVYSSTGSLVYLFPRRPVCGSTGLLVYLFTCLLVPASTRLRSTGLLVYRFTCLLVSPVDGITIVRARQGGFGPAPRPRGPVRSPRGSRPEWCRRPRSCRTGFRVRARRFRS